MGRPHTSRVRAFDRGNASAARQTGGAGSGVGPVHGRDRQRDSSPSAFGDRLVCEAAEGCTRPTSGKLAAIQALARYIVDAPDHRGVAGALRSLAELRRTHPNFFDIELDCHVEFWEAVRLGDHANPDEGFAHIAHHRMHSRPKVPPKAISTIHKAKGLECDGVIVMPCDAKTFPDSSEARCLLYVALSRAKKRLLLVVSRDAPSSPVSGVAVLLSAQMHRAAWAPKFRWTSPACLSTGSKNSTNSTPVASTALGNSRYRSLHLTPAAPPRSRCACRDRPVHRLRFQRK